MNNEIEFDHFKDINELLKNIDSWYREDDIEYTRWFGLKDLYNLKIYITSLQQKVEQLENIRKEAIKWVKLMGKYENGSCTRNFKLMSADFNYLLNILNKGE